MKLRKVMAVVLAVGVIISGLVIVYKINIKGENLNQNVVYAKSNEYEDSLEDSLGEYKVTGEDEEAYKEKSTEIIKKYFGISIDDDQDLVFRASRINEKTMSKLQADLKNQLQDAYDNNEISKEEYDAEMEYCNGGPKDSYESSKRLVEKLKYGRISTLWINKEKNFQCTFNENTKELDEVMVGSIHDNTETSLSLSEEELKNKADDYIKKYKLGNMDDPECLMVKEVSSDPEREAVMKLDNLYYEDKNDDSKKVIVGIDQYTGEVVAFQLNAYADYIFDIMDK